jgi:hypothetical protein
VDDWKRIARQARNAVQGTKRGARQAAWKTAAGALDPNTVRRLVFSLDYLDSLKKADADLHKDLDGAPFSLIEILARWNSFDAKGSSLAAHEVARGKHTIASLSGVMKEARKNTVLNRSGKSLTAAFREQVALIAARVVQDKLGGMISDPSVGHKEADYPRLDFKFLRMTNEGNEPEYVAVIIVGPYSSNDAYVKRRYEWLLRAFAFAWIYDHVFLWIPPAADPKPYVAWVERAKADVLLLASRSKRDENKKKPIEARVPNVYVVQPEFPKEQRRQNKIR